MHSVQNVILLDCTAHIYFDKYLLAIDPDNDYKVVCFTHQARFDGMKMHRNPNVDEKYQPCRALLRHHFRMAVLLNMNARAGHPEWDEDIPEGYDQMAEITYPNKDSFDSRQFWLGNSIASSLDRTHKRRIKYSTSAVSTVEAEILIVKWRNFSVSGFQYAKSRHLIRPSTIATSERKVGDS
ncbi:hypothetical protein EI94DRAFT_1191543 [Lactarius quietus]|nr:hypothetical protein EI94DRAFT_1191543 [Lactarius quietus]